MKHFSIILIIAISFYGCKEDTNEISKIKSQKTSVNTDNKAGLNKYIEDGNKYIKESNISNKYEVAKKDTQKISTELKDKATVIAEEKLALAKDTFSNGGESLKTYAKDAFKKSWEEAKRKEMEKKEKGFSDL
jgi:hypothetical protein